MQVFVSRNTLTGLADENVHVIASYEDAVLIDPAVHGTGATIMIMPVDAVQMGVPMSLVQDWRTRFEVQIITGEANKRIIAAFPDYSQRNANAEINGYITSYGADSSAWPAGPQSRKAEIDRCWQYVNDVRAKANALGEAMLPVDPTADGNWPTVISPYVPS